MVQAPSRRRRGRRVLLAGLAAGALLASMFAGVQALNRGRAMREAFPQVEGSAPLKGLGSVATVTRDPRGIPHIEAAGEADAYRVLGLVHAQERLAQMEWLRRSAQGRLSEVLGPRALDADREARVVGIAHHARRALDHLPERTLELLSAYVAGINAHVERLQTEEAALPLPLRRLEIQPERWSEADTVALVKLYAWTLAGHPEAGMVLQELIELLGGFGARPFFPPGVGSAGLADSPGTASSRQCRRRARIPRRPPGRVLSRSSLASVAGASGAAPSLSADGTHAAAAPSSPPMHTFPSLRRASSTRPTCAGPRVR